MRQPGLLDGLRAACAPRSGWSAAAPSPPTIIGTVPRSAPARRPVVRAALAATAVVVLSAGMLAACSPSAEDQRDQTIAAASSESATFTLSAEADVVVTEDVAIATAPGVGMLVDVCRAEGATELRPAVLAVHGGSWARGDKAHPHWRTICSWLAGEGFVGVSVNYRLAPEHPFPAGADDLAAAVAWAQSDAAGAFGIDPERTALLGGSAGGNLSALVALEAAAGEGRSGIDPLDAVITLSSPLDLTVGSATSPTFEQSMLDYLDCAARDCERATDASPQTLVGEDAPPFLIVHGTREQLIPVQQATAFIGALAAAGSPATRELIDSEAHSIGLLDDALAGRLAEWLRGMLVPAPAVEALDETPLAASQPGGAGAAAVALD